ncbi:MAG: N-acetylneuraminate synthase family protein [Candidatus Muiribacteriota bacterium]
MLINKFEINNNKKPFIIAEIGVNHNGNINLAKKMISNAKNAGAHAVKFQTWSKKSLYGEKFLEDKPDFEKQIDEFSLTFSEFKELASFCKKENIIFSATPFSEEEVDFLVEMDVQFLKVASMDLNNYPFLDYIAKKNIPVFLSTGFAQKEEINKALEVIKNTGNRQIVLMHCVADYPPLPETLNLENIKWMIDRFKIPVGYSDHSLNIYPCLYAVYNGACVVERHFTLDKNMEGWDHKISSDEKELNELVLQSGIIPAMRGQYEREVSNEELDKRKNFRRSIVAKKDILSGDRFTKENIYLARPGFGIPPEEYDNLLGVEAKKDYKAGEIIL